LDRTIFANYAAEHPFGRCGMEPPGLAKVAEKSGEKYAALAGLGPAVYVRLFFDHSSIGEEDSVSPPAGIYYVG
jgi:hypothetical protein